MSTSGLPSAMLAASIETQAKLVLDALASRPTKPKPKQVHELRVAVRRLLAALELVALLGRDVRPRARRRLKKLLRSLSPLRDAHVQLRTVEQLQRKELLRGVELALRAEQRRRRSEAVARLAAIDVGELRRDLSALTDGLIAFPPDAAHVDLARAVLLGELSRRHLRIEDGRRHAAPNDARALHQCRLSLKSYRYALELLKPQLPERAGPLLETTVALQDQLGAAHDRHVLAESVDAYVKSLGRRQAAKLEGWTGELGRAKDEAENAAARALQTAHLPLPVLLPTPSVESVPPT